MKKVFVDKINRLMYNLKIDNILKNRQNNNEKNNLKKELYKLYFKIKDKIAIIEFLKNIQ